jgi:hypothetical protein
VALLVDLDGVDAALATLAAELGDGGAEGVVDPADAVVEDVGETRQDGELDAARLELVARLSLNAVAPSSCGD